MHGHPAMGIFDDLAGRRQMFEVAMGAGPHGLQRAVPSFVGRIKIKCRRLVVTDGAEPITLCGRQIAVPEGGVGAVIADVGHPSPFPMPGVVIPCIDPACRQQAFGNRRTAFLSHSQNPHELEREVFVSRPMNHSSGIKLQSHVDRGAGDRERDISHQADAH